MLALVVLLSTSIAPTAVGSRGSAARQLSDGAFAPASRWAVSAGSKISGVAGWQHGNWSNDTSSIIAGSFEGTASFGAAGSLTSAGGSDAFVAMLDSAGTTVWARRLGGADDDSGHSVAVHGDGSSVVIGTFKGTLDLGAAATLDLGAAATLVAAGSKDDIFVAQVNSSGAFLWAIRLGGTGIDKGFGIAAHADGTTVVSGQFAGTAYFGAAGTLITTGSNDAFVAKLGPAGDVLWVTRLGGISGDYSFGVAAQADGTTVTTGRFFGTASFGAAGNLISAGQGDAFVAKLGSANGDVLWARRLGGEQEDKGYSIAAHSDGSSVVTGFFQGKADFGTTNLTKSPAGGADVFVTKLDASGAFLWATAFGGDASGRGVAAHADGSSVVTGYFSMTMGAIKSAGAADAFVTQVSTTGAIVSAMRLGDSGQDEGLAVAARGDGTAVVVGSLGAAATLSSVSLVLGGFASSTSFPCATGRHSTVTGGVTPCVGCPVGWFQSMTGFDACMECPAGKYQPRVGQALCSACDKGQYESSSTTCSDCEAGQYADEAALAECKPCSAGRTQPSHGSTSCSPCATGRFSAVSSSSNSTCNPCPSGRYTNVQAQPSCVACPPGKFQPAEGQDTCDACASATGNAQSACDTAIVCNAGQAGTTLDGGCANCTPGRFKASRNVQPCTICPCGTFSTSSGATECSSSCPTGTYGDASKGVCASCSSGFFCIDSEKRPFAKASTCTPGEYESAAPSATSDRSCETCPVMHFSNHSNAAVCDRCPTGKFQGTVGQPFCEIKLPCAPGTFEADSTETSTARCQECPAQFFSNTSNAPECLRCSSVACPNNAHRKGCGGTTEGYCSTCSPGTFVDGSACSACAAGRFSSNENAVTCDPCSPTMFQPQAGKGFCLPRAACAKGERVRTQPDATADRTCGKCPVMHFSDVANAATCERCPAGKFQKLQGQPDCEAKQPCAPGSFEANATDVTNTRCHLCPEMYFSKASNAPTCERCPTGKFQKLQGQPYCEAKQPCVPGSFEADAMDVSDARCRLCPEMHFSNVSNAVACERCPSGKYQGAAGQAYCETKQPCAPGTFDTNATETSSTRCKPCPAGYWCQDGTQYPCGSANLFCPAQSATPSAVAIGHFSVNGLDEFHREEQMPCEPGFSCAQGIRHVCPPGRVCLLGSATAQIDGVLINVTSEARCDTDHFVFEGACQACPKRGVTCNDGRIALKPNFWYNPEHGSLTVFWGKREATAATNIYRCAPGSCGLSVTTGLPTCAAGRQGLLCGVCSEGYYATDISGCEPCPVGLSSAIEMVCILAFLTFLVAALWRAKRKLEKIHPQLAASIAEKLPEVLKLLTGLFQILGAFATVLYRVPWPGAFRAVTSFTNVLALDVFALPSIRCSSLGNTFYERFDLHMTSMLALTGMLVVLLFFAYSRCNQQCASPLKTSLVWNIFLPFLFLIYPGISKTAILMLRCRDVDGHSYLLSDLALSCETAEYESHKLYAIFGVLVFPIGTCVFFTALVGYNRKKLPPDWWPARTEAESQAEYQRYGVTCNDTFAVPRPFAVWQSEIWNPRMAKYDKLYKRVGFLFFGGSRHAPPLPHSVLPFFRVSPVLCSHFARARHSHAAYNKGYWWFEPVLLIYKLTMTVLILFVSDDDENKIMFGMLGATAMLATLSFFQPFKHPDILSINTGAQMVVLLVLFAAMFLIVNGGDSKIVAAVLVFSTLAPLAAGVAMTLRLPTDARAPEAGDAFSGDVSKAIKSIKGRDQRSAATKAPGAGSSASGAGASNPMRKVPRRTPSGDSAAEPRPVMPSRDKSTHFTCDNPMLPPTGDEHAAVEHAVGAGSLVQHTQLPPGWYHAIDPNSGNAFYYTDEGETSWVRPTATWLTLQTGRQSDV
jgi:hypothetical protein